VVDPDPYMDPYLRPSVFEIQIRIRIRNWDPGTKITPNFVGSHTGTFLRLFLIMPVQESNVN